MLSKSVTNLPCERRRSRAEITAEILRIAKGGARKTRIVYGANINFKLLEEYLRRLEKAGLITRENGKISIIRTTEKGIEYLHRYENLESLGIL
ncbi:MAG: winged helix-turn-helix domain-containing protein [Candidatus Bathyarchaeia archaeon]|nr:winged helix DNA-binding protein [Candidatus Bathyarchaeota archaeon]